MVLFKWTLTIVTEAYYKNYVIQSAVSSFTSLKSESFCNASAIKSCHKKFMNEKVFARNLINKFLSAIAQSVMHVHCQYMYSDWLYHNLSFIERQNNEHKWNNPCMLTFNEANEFNQKFTMQLHSFRLKHCYLIVILRNESIHRTRLNLDIRFKMFEGIEWFSIFHTMS